MSADEATPHGKNRPVDDEDTPCVCGHEQDDHLVRLSVSGNVYGPCRVTTDKWNPCMCDGYEADR